VAAPVIVEVGAPADVMKRARTVLILSGVLGLVGGAVAIIVPAAASVATTLFIGWLLVFGGVIRAFRAFGAETHGRDRAWALAEAALALIAGLIMVIFPLNGTLGLTFFLSAWFAATGILELVAAFRLRPAPGWGWVAFDGGLSLVLGLLIALSLPSSAAWAVGLIVGVSLIFWGTRSLIAGWALHKALRAR
jgi:uncharacterized membrane protein HdeD (DUF308 family)